MNVYVGVLVLGAIAALFAIGSVVTGALVGPRRVNSAKIDAYECGIQPSPVPDSGGGRFPVKYYLTAMLFIVFDIEIIFLYPWAVAFDNLGAFGLIEMVLFIATSASPTATSGDVADWSGTKPCLVLLRRSCPAVSC